MSLAPTAIAFAARAGLIVEASAGPFPAATTTMTPALVIWADCQARIVDRKGKHLTVVTALSTAVEAPPPKLMEAMLGRPVPGAVVATQSIPEILHIPSSRLE
jgi:hypothetical protein